MYESPGNLQDFCLDYISNNIGSLCSASDGSDDMTQQSPCGEFFLPNYLSDQLLQSLCQKQKLTDETMAFFNSESTRLKRVKIHNAPLTVNGLKVLKSHKIVELQCSGLKQVSINDLIGCLGEWTLSHLRLLNVNNSTFINSARFCVLVSLSKLKNLHTLNVSFTEFTEFGLDIVAEDLTLLENLDISGTPVNDLTPLRKCKDRLKVLLMYNLRSSHKDQTVSVLCELKHLRHLDVSDDFSLQPFMSSNMQLQQSKFKVNSLLSQCECLPELRALDISGKDKVDEELLREFVSAHPQLCFLGLALTDACCLDIFDDKKSQHIPGIKVSGEATEMQLVEALQQYYNRPIFVQRTLYHLFSITQHYTQPRLDIIKVILPAMRHHLKELGVQMAATACLYNLSRSEHGKKIHPKWLAHIIELTMGAMEHFPNHQQLQKNALLTLCSDRILQDVTFDRFQCAKLVLESLCTFNEASMTRMSVAIVGILAAKIPTMETSLLGAEARYMTKMLDIVKDKMQQVSVDITMRFTLSALWNLTDESPETCEMFLKQGGLDLFLQVLKTYSEKDADVRVQVETKVLGLVNNVAEVQGLRGALLNDAVMTIVRDLLHSKHIDVSYFAAGILSHIVSDLELEWESLEMPKQELLKHLEECVLLWQDPQREMVAYRSFFPFFPLLERYDLPQVQLWSVWAMHHVCTKNGQRYCPMLVKEGGCELLETLSQNPKTKPEVARIAGDVLHLIRNIINQ